jgi:hypothetical protein
MLIGCTTQPRQYFEALLSLLRREGGTLVRMNALLLQIGIVWFALFSSSACDLQKTAREKANLQYDSDKQTKFKELEPSEGQFIGSMHLIASDQNFDVVLNVKRVIMIERAPQSQNPSETIEVPKLSGSMSFLALSNMDPRDYAYFQELLKPMGGYLIVTFDFGNYSSLSKSLILPYIIPNQSNGPFGVISGILEGDHFKGTWFANPLGNVGTFDLIRNASERFSL